MSKSTINIDNLPDILTISEAAQAAEVSRQAIYRAIKNERIKGKKINNTWTFTNHEFEEYMKFRYSRQFSTYQGELLFDIEKGEYSVPEAAKKCGVNEQHIYYKLRRGELKGRKKGGAWVLNYEDLVETFKEKIQKENEKQLKMEM